MKTSWRPSSPGDLEPKEHEALEAHLDACAAYRAVVAELVRVFAHTNMPTLPTDPLSSDTLAVGATGEDGEDDSISQSGAVYVFLRTGAVWAQEAIIRASNPGNGDLFGGILTISENTLAVGVPREDSDGTGEGNNGATNSGAVYVFERNGALWTQQAYLKASNLETFDGFGGAVALAGDVLAVGATGEDSDATGVNGEQDENSASVSGAAYLLIRSASVWGQQAYVKASNTDEFDRFGADVLGQLLPKVFGHATASGATMVGPPFVRYQNMAAFLDIEAGMPVAPGAAGTDDIELGELPAGPALTTIHTGPYDGLPGAYSALQAWMKEHDITPSGGPWEVYLTDPGEVPDPAEWKTQIFWPIAE